MLQKPHGSNWLTPNKKSPFFVEMYLYTSKLLQITPEEVF